MQRLLSLSSGSGGGSGISQWGLETDFIQGHNPPGIKEPMDGRRRRLGDRGIRSNAENVIEFTEKSCARRSAKYLHNIERSSNLAGNGRITDPEPLRDVSGIEKAYRPSLNNIIGYSQKRKCALEEDTYSEVVTCCSRYLN